MGKFSGLGLAVDQPSRLILLHPATAEPIRDKDGNEAWIDLLSKEGTAARDHSRKISDQVLQGKRQNVTARQVDEELVESLCIITKAWNLIALDGTALNVECTEANARELYAAPSTAWIATQVNNFAKTRANFVKASSIS